MYTLKPEHEARFGEIRDKWISIARSTGRMTDGEKEEVKDCVTAKRLKISQARLKSLLEGHGIVAEGAWTLTHEEHADYTNPGGTFITWGQLNPQTMRRVQD